MHNQNKIQEILSGHKQIPVVSFEADDDPIAFMEYLISKGVYCIEVTLRTSAAFQAIDSLKKRNFSDVIIGAGTVINSKQVEQLESLNVDFMVSPGITPKLEKKLGRSNIAYLPGVVTPSEIIKAKEMGLNTLKFFPAQSFGGLETLKSYQAVFPDIKFCPTGGISQENSGDYLALENVIAVGGSWFQKDFKKTK